jgi:hypothetical protein
MMRTRFLFSTAGLLVGVAFAFAQSGKQLPRPSEVVKPRVFVSLDPVPRGAQFEIAVVAEIRKGFHINANQVLEDYLIPTTLQAEAAPGVRVLETLYPAGQLQKFEFSDERLNVYDGTITLRMKLEAAADASIGPVKLPLSLRYQACNDTTCLPPVKLPLAAEFPIAAAGTKPRAAHPEIFHKK